MELDLERYQPAPAVDEQADLVGVRRVPEVQAPNRLISRRDCSEVKVSFGCGWATSENAEHV